MSSQPFQNEEFVHNNPQLVELSMICVGKGTISYTKRRYDICDRKFRQDYSNVTERYHHRRLNIVTWPNDLTCNEPGEFVLSIFNIQLLN